MRRIALVLEYEGTAYAGFQYQANAPSVQGEIERAIEALTGRWARLKGAGRTDAGVHAAAQVAAFDTESSLAVERFRHGLNRYLPDDIAVTAAHEVPAGFDPRRHATARVYRYTFLERDVRSPLRRCSVYVTGRALDVDAMREAASCLPGRRDFAPFSGPLPKGRTMVRRLDRADIWREGDEVYLELEGNAFLPQQVRRTAAALLDVGEGKTTPSAFRALAESKQQGAATRVLPPAGLCLRQVKYGEFPPSHAADTNHNPRQAH